MRTSLKYGAILAAHLLFPAPLFAQLLGITWGNGGELYSISTTDASVKLIGKTGLNLPESLEFGPDLRLYTTTDGVPGLTSELYTINPFTAHATLIGPTGVPQFEGALVFAGDGTAYGGGSGPSNIYTIDTTTGTATVLGSIGVHDVNGLAFRSDGVLVAFEGAPQSSLYAIDLSTLSTTHIGTLPALRSIGGMAVFGDTAYLVGRLFADQVDSLFRVDLYTGRNSLVGKIDLHWSSFNSGYFSGLAAIPVPEPAWTTTTIGAILCFCFPRCRPTDVRQQ